MHELHKFNFMTTSTLLRNINPESENIHLPHVQNPLRLDFADFPEFREFIRNRSDHKFTTDICFWGGRYLNL